MRARDNIKKIRKQKASNIEESGINPYPSKISALRKKTRDVILNFEKLKEKDVLIAGRIKSIRGHGALTFLGVEDDEGNMQALLNKEELGKKTYKFFLDNFDVGDFIEIKGTLFLTKRGEKTINIKKYKILSKALLPLPEKWHGLKDTEERFRKRYLDFLMSAETRKKFIIKSKIINEIREFLNKKDFIEVETPILQEMHGGAAAKPFKTHLHAMDINLYLRISPELYLKRLLVGGFEKVFEIGRIFRNEGMDASHNPDFTSLEFYWAYADYKDLMNFYEEMFLFLVLKIFGKKTVAYQDKKIDFSPPFAVIDFFDLIEDKTGYDMKDLDEKEVVKIAKNFDILTEGKSKPKLLDDIYKKKCREDIINPTFIIHQPIGLTPLAKKLESDPKLAARFQIVVAGWEIVNSFSELNNPIEQKKRFKEQIKIKEKGDIEAHPFDEDYIEAMEHGMPPAAGSGLGIDRLVAILTNSEALRDITLFPLMRPKK